MIINPSGENAPDQNETHRAGRGSTGSSMGTDLVLMRERWKQGESGSQDQRKEEQDDLAFYAGEQWPSQVVEARRGQPGNVSTGIPPVPARPLITVNLVREPIRQVLNQERQSDYGLELVPADDWGTSPDSNISHDEIELREGLVRRIQRQSDAQIARNWAFERSAIAGQGWYLIETRYVSDRSSDLELCITKIYNQFGVMDDPNSTADDGSDADWRFVGQTYTHEAYKAEWPFLADGTPNDTSGASDDQWRALGEEAPGWFTTQGSVRYVRVMRYYHVERSPIKVIHLQDGRAVPEALFQPATMQPVVDKDGKPEGRTVTRKKVIITTTDGVNVLDETEWVTSTIPVVKVLGEGLHPWDEKRREQGLVRSSRSSNQGFNWLLSKGVETVALTPIPPMMLAKGQEEGLEAWFQSLATRTLPYALYHNKDENGDPIGPPTRPPTNMDLVTPIVGMSQLFQTLVKSTTGVPDPTLGNVDPSIRSNRALKTLLAQAEKGTSNYLDNLQTSIRYEARVLNEALPRVYGRPGRMAAMVTANGDPQRVLLHQPMVMTPANGQPARPQLAQPGDQNAKTYRLTPDADFNVAIKVGKNFDTRRQEENDSTGELIGQNPELMTWFGDLYFENQDGPGHEEMAKRAKVMLAPPIQQLLSQDAQAPPHIQAQMAQMGQQLQEANQQLQQAMMIIQAKKVEKEADLAKAQMDNDTKIEIARLQASNQFAVADLKAGLEAARTAIEAMEEQRIAMKEAADMGREHQHDHNLSEREHYQEMARTAQQHEHAVEQAHLAGAQQFIQSGVEHELTTAQQAQKGQQAMEQQQQAAAQQPQPTEPSGAEGQ